MLAGGPAVFELEADFRHTVFFAVGASIVVPVVVFLNRNCSALGSFFQDSVACVSIVTGKE